MSHGIAEHEYKFLNVQVSKSIIQIMIKRNVFKQKYQLKKKKTAGGNVKIYVKIYYRFVTGYKETQTVSAVT